MTNKAFQSPESFIYCGFADAPPEAHQSTDSEDRPQSEEQSSPADPCSFEEEVKLESPLPAHPEPTRPPVAPTQPYYLNGELQKHISPSDFIKIFYFLRCYGQYCNNAHYMDNLALIFIFAHSMDNLH